MLALGIICLSLGIFLLWVMQQGGNFITAHNWQTAVNQTGTALKQWLVNKPSGSVQ